MPPLFPLYVVLTTAVVSGAPLRKLWPLLAASLNSSARAAHSLRPRKTLPIPALVTAAAAAEEAVVVVVVVVVVMVGRS